ncbi:MAG: dihydropteroate synthase [Euryarchaeota archaeon]|nr:dihydropteroate synthase [Euryarchaeota archaeon]
MFNPHMVIELRREMERMGVSAEGIEIMEKKGEFYTIKIEDVPLRGAIILKQEALAAGMECALPWCVAGLKCEKTPALLFGTERQFEILIKKMKKEPFKGAVLAEELEECITNCRKSKFEIRAGKYRISIPPFRVMGILNVTPDSFSDGGKFIDKERAVQHAKEMIAQGADIIDVGGESSRPFSEPVSTEEELRRVIPIIDSLSDLNIPISVDTYKPEVARAALEHGAVIVNDIFGLRKEGMAEVIREYDAGVVIMHMKGEPKNMQLNPSYDDVVSEVLQFLRERVRYALDSGIEKDRIIIDPGIGFGKRVEDNLMLIRSLRSFTALGVPVLVGVSRKSYIGKILGTDVNERLEGTLASNVMALAGGATIFRVHDVRENARALKMAQKIMEGFA